MRGGKDRSIEGIAWVQSGSPKIPNRLFSIGSSNYVSEWDIMSGLAKEHLASNAGAIWSITTSPDGNLLALGCEDGSIQLVDVQYGAFTYSRLLERQNSRVLSLSWDPHGKFIVGGCGDSTLRVWELTHGRLIATMKLDQASAKSPKRKKRKLDTIAWAVKVSSDGTVISGDSTGSLNIWESQFWSLKQSFRVHRADILCLALDNVFPLTCSSDVRMSRLFIPAGLIGRRCGIRLWEMGNGLMLVEIRFINMMSEQ